VLESKKSKTFLTSNGYEVIVDAEDYKKVTTHKWFAYCKNNIVLRVQRSNSTNTSTLAIHRFILNIKTKKHIDHVNRNVLDNRKYNLREATPSENMMNRAKLKSKSSSYKGVSFYRNSTGPLWTARIQFNKKSVFLGFFKNENDAARAYNIAATKHHKEFAFLNIIKDQEEKVFKLIRPSLATFNKTEYQDYSFLFPVC